MLHHSLQSQEKTIYKEISVLFEMSPDMQNSYETDLSATHVPHSLQ